MALLPGVRLATRSPLAVGLISIMLLTSLAPALAQPDPAPGAAAPITGATVPTKGLALDRALQLAYQNDPWLIRSEFAERALQEEAVAVAQLPDPRITLTGANLPVNTFDSNQEAMTQFAIGFSQQFPRGDSRTLLAEQKSLLGEQQPHLRSDRKLRVMVTVAEQWLDGWQAQQTIDLIERDYHLFEQLVDVVEAGYGSASGRSGQQDLIRAQLELTRLDDRLAALRISYHRNLQRLAEWTGQPALNAGLAAELPEQFAATPPIKLDTLTREQIAQRLQRHPAIQAFDRQIEASETGVQLEQQKYRPEWGINAQYGYREDQPGGAKRSDLLTVGISFDLPLFTAKRQDRRVNAAHANTQALKADRSLLLRQMIAQVESARAEQHHLRDRIAIYRQQLLPRMADHAESALSAYTHDVGDFAETVRSRIAELNARIEQLNLSAEALKLQARLAYLLLEQPPADTLAMTAGVDHE